MDQQSRQATRLWPVGRLRSSLRTSHSECTSTTVSSTSGGCATSRSIRAVTCQCASTLSRATRDHHVHATTGSVHTTTRVHVTSCVLRATTDRLCASSMQPDRHRTSRTFSLGRPLGDRRRCSQRELWSDHELPRRQLRRMQRNTNLQQVPREGAKGGRVQVLGL